MKTFLYLVSLLAIFLTNSTVKGQDFPYSLSKNDFVIGGAGLFSLSTGYIFTHDKEPLTVNQIDQLHQKSINKFDRISTKKWSPKADITSDYMVGGLITSGSLLGLQFVKKRDLSSVLVIGTMYVENLALVLGVTQTTKNIVKRNRPYLYNNQLTNSEKVHAMASTSGHNSFYSMHTAYAFSSAMFISKVYGDLYGKETDYWIITGSVYTIATSIGMLRVFAGRHYPTDVITGAIAGTVIGYSIPQLHKLKNPNLTLMILPGFGYLTYRF